MNILHGRIWNYHGSSFTMKNIHNMYQLSLLFTHSRCTLWWVALDIIV